MLEETLAGDTQQQSNHVPLCKQSFLSPFSACPPTPHIFSPPFILQPSEGGAGTPKVCLPSKQTNWKQEVKEVR